MRPRIFNRRVFDEPTIAATLADEGSASLSLEQRELGEIVTVGRVGGADRRVDQAFLSCASLPRIVRR
jgi:hypothetical protein